MKAIVRLVFSLLAIAAPRAAGSAGVPVYQERSRGQVHFSAGRGWINDPNGLAFYRGEYHLFFQHNPHGWNWGDMHWGHATSRDLVHWEEHPDALQPDKIGPIFSGSTVVDWGNTSGLGHPGDPPLVLIYTAAGPRGGEAIASSTDGRTFAKYVRNPVIGKFVTGDRDPKVLWHSPTRRWVMVLYGGPHRPGGERTADGLPSEQHTLYFFTSPNLRDWTLASTLRGGVGDDHYLYECPDLFELPVDGNPADRKWVLRTANCAYAVGRFDGRSFQPESSRIPGVVGKGCYAPQTFSDTPDGRRIEIAWFKTVTPGMPFNQSLTIPHELKLTATPAGPRLARFPVREMDSLRVRSHELGPVNLRPGSPNSLSGINAELVELRAAFDPGEKGVVSFTIRGARIAYDAATGELAVNDLRATVPRRGGGQSITVYCDRTGLEVFASGGLVYVPLPFQPEPGDRSLGAKVEAGEAKFTELVVYELGSIWAHRRL